jgi:chemotaxis protein histidine kinase CheA
MSVVRHIPYVNRLAKAISIPGGKRVFEAVADADANLKTIEVPCLEAVDAYIASIQQLAARPDDAEALNQIYSESNIVIGLAGVFGLRDLSAAAWSLCELVDSRPESGGVDPMAMAVHIDSLRLLRQGDAVDPAQREAMLEGLGKVVARAKRATAAA